MSTMLPPIAPELEDEIRPYRERIEQIDRVLDGPARTLIRQTIDAANKNDESPPRFPLWIAYDPVRNSWPNALTTSLCLVTLHRLHRMRRRFPTLGRALDELGDDLDELRRGYLPDRKALGENGYFAACAHFVDSRTFGFLNPFTSAQVFRLLMESGEDHAHTGVGCLSFFAMVWPLFRENSLDRLDIGARIEPYRPTAYVTAKCLLPLIELRTICRKRAKLFMALKQHVKALQHLLKESTSSSRGHWQFCAEVDALRVHLQAMAEISISRASFVQCDAALDAPLAECRPHRDQSTLFDTVVRELALALQGVAERSDALLGDASAILKVLDEQVIPPLKKGMVPPDIRGTATTAGESRRVFRFELPDDERTSKYKPYLEELGSAASEATTLCGEILGALKQAANLPLGAIPEMIDPLNRDLVTESLLSALDTMVGVNEAVAEIVERPVDLHTRWCHTVVNRHVAFAAAKNFTDFDASELVSALAVVVRSKQLVAEAEVSNALKKAVVAVERDGSWRLSHPYFSADGLQALRAPAADVVWTLVSALARFPTIRVADQALFSFVDWLERTRREIPPTLGDPSRPETDFGWSADQMREHHRIELFTTAYAVNALLAIRDLAEQRLWELCERRFTIVRNSKQLHEMAPVDLMVPHGHRLHSTLSRIMRHNRSGAGKPVYSLVLHGPPGSSKTTVAGALSHAMGGDGRWGRDRRLVRVTPADFTRLGEDRVDAQAHAIFELLRHVRGVTILFDEIDDLLRRREFTPNNHPRFLDLVIPAMLNRLQDLRDVCRQQEICFLFGTNYVERIEPALMRRGRIDLILAVPYPDQYSRSAIAEEELNLATTLLPGINEEGAWKAALVQACEEIAQRTPGWSWNGVRSLARAVAERVNAVVTDLVKSGAVVGPPEAVVRNWGALVDDELKKNPADIQTDTIYPNRLFHGTPSRDLHRETLRHYLTYCSKPRGAALKIEMEGELKRLMSSLKELDPEHVNLDTLHTDLRAVNEELLQELDLLDREHHNH